MLSYPVLAAEYHYDEQRVKVFDTKNRMLSESFNYRFVTIDHELKRISVETTEATMDFEFRNRHLYRIYKLPSKQWILEDTLNPEIKLNLTVRNKDGSEWPVRNYTAEGMWEDKGKQKITFEQNLSQQHGRIDFFDWKGNPKGYVLIDGKVIHEAQYLGFLKKVKH